MQTTVRSFIFIVSVTIISLVLIILNAVLSLNIPFTVTFLIGFIGFLLVFAIWHSIETKGVKKTLVLFSVSFVIAFVAEALGVNYGLIFGDYFYTPELGIQAFGVPFLAALAWEPILYAAFTLTTSLASMEPPASWEDRIPAYLWLAGAGALATTAWDMMIDPIAVSQGWWVWENGGAYLPYVANGVPISNFMGWLGVSFVIQMVYRVVVGDTHASTSNYPDVYGPLGLYACLFLTACGVAVTILKRPEVALVGLLAMGPFLSIGLTHLNFGLSHQRALLGSKMKDIGF
jgi:uncharacterized membrane protein